MELEVDKEKLTRLLRYATLAFLIPKFGRWWPEAYVQAVDYRLEERER